MRLVVAGLAAFLACGVASAQTPVSPKPPASVAPKPTTPAAPASPGKYTTPLPEMPAGQWGDGILKDAKTQSFDGKDYAAVDFERLQAHVDSICHYDKDADIIGKPVATIVGYRQNMGWPALVDGRQIDVVVEAFSQGAIDYVVKPLDENKHLDKLVMPFFLVDVTPFLDDVRNDDYFKACGGLNFKVCGVAIYGHFEWRPAKEIPDLGADLLVGDKKCMFVLEHYRKMGIVDFGDAVNKMALDSFYRGMAVSSAKGGH